MFSPNYTEAAGLAKPTNCLPPTLSHVRAFGIGGQEQYQGDSTKVQASATAALERAGAFDKLGCLGPARVACEQQYMPRDKSLPRSAPGTQAGLLAAFHQKRAGPLV